MNSSTILKRTLPLIIVLLLIIGVAVSCSLFNKEKAIPGITDSEAIYFEVEEGGRKYSITNDEIYKSLKSSVGLSILLENIDKDLLKVTTVGTSNYYDAVTAKEIEDEIEKAVFPEGKDDLTAEEITKAEDAFVEKMQLDNGLRNQTEIDEYYRLIVARRNYAKFALEKEIKETDKKASEDNTLEKYFTEKEIDNYYKANYLNGYWSVIVPFSSKVEGETMLEQLGIKIHTADSTVSGDFTKWVWAELNEEGKEVELTTDEVIKAFIDMYNSVYSYKVPNYPTNYKLLTEGVEYSVSTEGKITFNTTLNEDEDSNLNRFYWSNAEIKAYQSEIQNFLKVSLNSMNSDSTIKSGKTWFTPQIKSYNNSTLFVYILKIAEEEAAKLEDVKDEIIEKLTEAELTDNYINKALAKLREEKGIIIYDAELEADYSDRLDSLDLEFKTTKEESKTIIAKVNGKDYSADLLFDLMDYKFGMTIATSEINYLRLLHSEELNKIYNYYLTDAKEAQKILDRETWKSIRDRAVNEKRNFAANSYSSYGFPATYGWNNFLRDYYGVASSEELPYYFLYSEILSKFSTSLGDVKELKADSQLWKTYLEKMGKIADEYFSVTGIHLLISVNDEEGKPTHPDKWTQTQRDYAIQLYEQVWAYYDSATGTASEKLKMINDKFNEAPRFVISDTYNPSNQPAGFNYNFEEAGEYSFEFAKAKTAGLNIKFEDLGAFTNGKMVKEFEDVVREIWKADPSSQVVTPYRGYDLNTDTYTPITTEFGYHAYINTGSTDIKKWDSEAEGLEGVLPTLQMVKTYLNDNAAIYLIDENGEVTDEDFTEAMKTAVTTYFTPVNKEITGSYYATSELYGQLKDLNISFKSGNYTLADFNNFLDLRIKSYQSNLVYFAVEE